MSSKKKRKKQYKGSVNATQPTVVKVSAVKRPPLQQWWIDHKRVVKPALIAAIVVAVIVIVIIGIVDFIF